MNEFTLWAIARVTDSVAFIGRVRQSECAIYSSRDRANEVLADSTDIRSNVKLQVVPIACRVISESEAEALEQR